MVNIPSVPCEGRGLEEKRVI